MIMRTTKIRTLSILLAFILNGLYSQEDTQARFPVILDLNARDLGFKQYLSDVEAARRRIAHLERTGEPQTLIAEALTVYAYTPELRDTLLSLAARCAIPYASLATLNRIAHQGTLDTQKPLLLPSAPGLFIPETPESDLELLLSSSRSNQEGIRITLTRQGRKEGFRFLPGADFSPTERVFFLHTGFRYPLRDYRLTSAFGPRINPVTGVLRNHNGLDLAAPAGTEVYAVREGVVAEVGEDTVYGKYVVIQHGEGWVSLYGHLSKIDAVLRRNVESGTLIGRVGSTGQSTGPHLHFELRQNGAARDPGKYLFKEGMY
jgi:murein DD-endopeptidase MepM/ murein hydrolase activator NlpD